MHDVPPADFDDEDVLDVAIVGAGASGAYAAYRLSREWERSPMLRDMVRRAGRERPRIQVFDMLDRVGGRLWSYRFAQEPHLIAELGGQGFSALHRNVHGLATKELNLDVVDCPAFNHPLFQYLRGSRFAPSALCDPANYLGADPGDADAPIRYFVRPEERKPPSKALLERLLQTIPQICAPYREVMKILCEGGEEAVPRALPALSALFETLRFADVSSALRPPHAKASEYGYWNWMIENFSNEAYRLSVDSAFTVSFDQNFNLYDTVVGFLSVYFAYAAPPAFRTIKDGYDQVPKALMRGFEACEGARTLRAEARGVRLVPHGQEEILALDIRPVGADYTYAAPARSVVLALPKLALSRLDRDGVLFANPEFQSRLEAVYATPASKLFFLYDEAWWKSALPPDGPSLGYATTDLPIKSCYYMGENPRSGRALMLSSLTDSMNAQFWNRFGSGGRDPEDLKVPPAMVEEVSHQLSRMHFPQGDEHAPPPQAAVFQNWIEPPFSGGWHLWQPNVASWEVMPEIRRPVNGVPLFICGEAYSALQGWVEGALNTTERTLQDHFGLPRAGWIDEDYDLGA
jgi:hypothetical protein